jgi:phospho-N-acetylmuramoyl-pentapeptide-transferase
MAALTAFCLSLVLGPWLIKKLFVLKVGEHVRTHDVGALYPLHKQKEGTPTMGGVLILLAVVGSTLLWADLTNKFILLVLVSTVWLGMVGFADDYIKLVKKRSKGLAMAAKLLGQILLGLAVGVYFYMSKDGATILEFPFLKKIVIDMSVFYIFFVMLVIVGTSNAVNLTDGLDGLAIGCTTIAALAYSILSYIAGNAILSKYLLISHIPGAGELTIFCASIIGAGLGFLWYNCYPAQVFMGDTGSLALGGALGIVAVTIKKELLLMIVGGIFVIEALSVIIQVISFKTTGRRIFLMSPLHHHFQLKGLNESKIIVRFWIIAILLALFTLATLKIR